MAILKAILSKTSISVFLKKLSVQKYPGINNMNTVQEMACITEKNEYPMFVQRIYEIKVLIHKRKVSQ